MSENEGSRFEEDISNLVDEIFEKEEEKGKKQLEQIIRINLIGNVNTGKSTAINTIVGKEETSTHATPGETVKIIEIKHPDNSNIIFVDTPGLNDINKKNSIKAIKDLKNADIVLYFLNAEGVVLGESELDTLNKISKRNKNVIVILNKIDGIEKNEVNSLKRYIEKTIEERFKVVPISAMTGENIEELNEIILEYLSEEGKDILFAKSLKVKSASAYKWILGASLSASAIGALPVPGSDIVPLTTLQVSLIIKLSMLYDKPISKDATMKVVVSTIAGGLGQNAFRQGVKFFPGIGSIIGAGVAGVITFGLGQTVKYALENNIEITPEHLKDIAEIFSNKS